MKTMIIAIILGLTFGSPLWADPLVDNATFSESAFAQESHLLPVTDALVLTVVGLSLLGWGRRHRWVS